MIMILYLGAFLSCLLHSTIMLMIQGRNWWVSCSLQSGLLHMYKAYRYLLMQQELYKCFLCSGDVLHVLNNFLSSEKELWLYYPTPTLIFSVVVCPRMEF
ncbi:hypothetical protein Dimus_004270 [Dionaea muscipula]